MKFTISIVYLILLTSVLPATSGNTQTKPRSQPSCVVIKPLERSTITSEQPVSQRSGQVQQISECALNTQPQPVRAEPRLSERNRSIKERFEQRVIPLQD